MLSKLQDLPLIITDFLLHGDYNLIFEQNKVVFEAVQEFLKESGWVAYFYISHISTPLASSLSSIHILL